MILAAFATAALAEAQYDDVNSKLNELKDGDEREAEPQAEHAADVGQELEGLSQSRLHA